MSSYSETMIDVAFRAYSAGRAREAETVLRMVVGATGRDAYVVYFIGHLSYLRGGMDDALFCLSASLTLDPNNARAHNDIGETLRAMGRNDLAVPHLERAIVLEPSLAHSYGNLAASLIALNRPEEALRWAQESLWRATDKAVAHCDLGSVFGRLNRPREALRQYSLALALKPDYQYARYFESLIRLGLGEMPAGWDGYEARLNIPNGIAGRRSHTRRRWRGATDLIQRRILLHAEQGLGDTLQFVRYAPLVAARGATVLLEVQPALKSLLEGMDRVKSVHAFNEALPSFDLQCPLMSLPAAFRTTMATIPRVVPYLRPDPVRVAAWAQRLGSWRRMRVGIAWSGSEGHASDLLRSIPLGRLDALTSRTDIQCHVIQRDIRAADRSVLDDLSGLVDHSAALTDFAETAALVSLMDLVISVDTAPAHLAGALGKPVWLLLALSADWRWLQDTSDSPWYPTMRLFRQKRRNDWQNVVETLGQQLDQWAIRH